jgi:hypothetical protein
MDHRLLFSLFMLTGICFALTAKAQDITVSTRDGRSAYTVTMHAFVPGSAETVETILTRKAATGIEPAH